MKKMNQWIALLLGLMLLFSCSIASASITPLPLDSDVGGAHPWKKENRLGEDKLEYKDESIHVKVEKFRHNGLRYIVAYVDIVDPSQIRTAASYGTYDDHRYVKTQIIAKSVNSIVCVNGDFFKYNDFGYLVRQCQSFVSVLMLSTMCCSLTTWAISTFLPFLPWTISISISPIWKKAALWSIPLTLDPF